MANIFSTPELALGIAVGGAAGAAFEPKLEIPKQSAWANNPQRLPDVGLIAALVAGGKVTMESGENMAARLGFDKGPFHSLTWLAQDRLNFPLMLRMWRLAAVNPNFDEAELSRLLDETLAHEQLDWDYHPYLRHLRHAELPGLGDIAYGVVRGILPAPSWVPVAPPTSGDLVPRFPQVNIDPLDLAHALGFNEDMLKVMVGRSGLSMAPIMAANALFRSNAAKAIAGLPDVPGVAPFGREPYVGPNDYLLAIAEGDLRTEWADAVKETARQILTAGQYAELELRGYIDKPTRRALTHQHGMSDFDSDLLYDVQGRGMSLHAAFIAHRRGGVFKGPTDDIPDWALWQLQRGNLRPEVFNLEWAQRHTLPSPFVIRGLLTDEAITEDRGKELYLWEGWPDDLAASVAKHYADKARSAAVNPYVKKAQSSLFTEAHKAYVKVGLSQAQVEPALVALAVPPADQTEVFHLWDVEKQLAAEVPAP